MEDIKQQERNTKLTRDGVPQHRRSRPLGVDRGDGHIVLRLGDEAGQVQGGDVGAHFNLEDTCQTDLLFHAGQTAKVTGGLTKSWRWTRTTDPTGEQGSSNTNTPERGSTTVNEAWT